MIRRVAAHWRFWLMVGASVAVVALAWSLQPRPSPPPPPGGNGWGRPGLDAYNSRWWRPTRPIRQAAPSQHFALESSGVLRVAGPVYSADLAGDGNEETLWLSADLVLQAANANGAVLARRRLPEGSGIRGAVDLDRDGVDEVLVSRRLPLGIRMELLRRDGRGFAVVRSMELKPKALQGMECRDGDNVAARECVLDDLDRDGTPEIILTWEAAVHIAGGDARRVRLRLVSCYRGDTGSEKWSYEVGTLPRTLTTGDVNGDGLAEIVFGSYAISNGLSRNGTDDSHSYVVALDASGKLLWRTGPLGGHYTGCDVALAQLDGDRRLEAVVAQSATFTDRTDRGAAYVLDGMSGRIRRRYESNYSVKQPAVGDVSGDSWPEVVVGCADGVIRVFDRKFRARTEIVVRSPVLVHALSDLDSDGKAEIVATTDDGRVIIADCSPGYPEPGVSEMQVSLGEDLLPSGSAALVADVSKRRAPEILAWFPRRGERAYDLHILCASRGEPAMIAGSPSQLTRSTTPVAEYAWDRAGERLAVVSGPALTVMRAGASGAQVVLNGRAVAAPCWGDAERVVVLTPGKTGWSGGLGRLLICNLSTREAKEADTGLLFGRPRWDEAVKHWFATVYDGSRWHVGRIALDGTVTSCTPPTEQPLGTMIGVLPGGRKLVFFRGVRHRLQSKSWTTSAFARTQAYCWDLDIRKAAPLVPAERLTETLRSGAAGIDAAAVKYWFTVDQVLLPGVAPCQERSTGQLLPQSATVVARCGREVSFPLIIARAHRESRGVWVGDSPHDLWSVDVSSGALRRLTDNDDTLETKPAWSPDGRWLAFEVERTDLVESGPEIWVTVPGRMRGAKLIDGQSPAWRPGSRDRRELTFLRNGQVWSAHVVEAAPSSPPLYDSEAFSFAVGGAAGIAAVLLVLAFGIPGRTLMLVRSLRLALQAVRRDRATVLLREVVSVVDSAESALHSLKNTLMLLPPLSDESDELEESLSYVLTDENATAVESLTALVLHSIDRLARLPYDVEELLSSLSPAVVRSYEDAAQALLRARSDLAARGCHLRTLTDRFAARGELDKQERADFVSQAYAEVEAFYKWLVDEDAGDGLFDVVRRASAPLRVGSAVNEALKPWAGRAAEMGVEVAVEGADSPARVPGDPRDLGQVLADVIGNALDAVAERAKTYGDAHRGRVAVSVCPDPEAGLTRIVIDDDGCGIDSALLASLRRGESATTKGDGRGMGLAAARRMIRRLPRGSIAIESPGPGRGCTVTLAFEEF